MIAAICDDDEFFREKLKTFLINYKIKHRLHIDILEFEDGNALLNYSESYDLVFFRLSNA